MLRSPNRSRSGHGRNDVGKECIGPPRKRRNRSRKYWPRPLFCVWVSCDLKSLAKYPWRYCAALDTGNPKQPFPAVSWHLTGALGPGSCPPIGLPSNSGKQNRDGALMPTKDCFCGRQDQRVSSIATKILSAAATCPASTVSRHSRTYRRTRNEVYGHQRDKRFQKTQGFANPKTAVPSRIPTWSPSQEKHRCL